MNAYRLTAFLACVTLSATSAEAQTPARNANVFAVSAAGVGAALGGAFVGMLIGGAVEYGVASAIGKAGGDRLSPFGRYAEGRPTPPRARLLAEGVGVAVVEPMMVAAAIHRANGRRGSFRNDWLASEASALAAAAVVLATTSNGGETGGAFTIALVQCAVTTLVETGRIKW